MFGSSESRLEGPSGAKDALRRELLGRRAALDPAVRANSGGRLVSVALDVPEVASATMVAAYVAVGTEPPTRPLCDGLRARGVAVLLPVVAPGNGLRWGRYAGPDALRRGRYGLLEPVGETLDASAAAQVDALLVPALAVDRRGHRLGRGGGYYDRLLAEVPRRTPVLAVVYDSELLAEVPVEPHDVPVDGALTPSGTERFRGTTATRDGMPEMSFFDRRRPSRTTDRHETAGGAALVADVDARAAAALVADGAAVLVDVREPAEWAAGHAPGAVHVPLGALHPAALPAGRRLVAVCRSGHRSAHAAEFLRAAGFDARNLSGGMLAWQQAGLPVERDDGAPGSVA